MWKPRDGGLGLGHGNVKTSPLGVVRCRFRYEIT